MDEVSTAIQSLSEVFEVLNIDTLKSNIANALESATCTEWEDITLPVNDLLTKVPALAGTSGCDVVIPMCKNLDFSNSVAALTDIREAFDSLFGIGHRLNSEATVAAHLFSKAISSGILVFKLRASMLVQWGAPSGVINIFSGFDGDLKFVKDLSSLSHLSLSNKKKAMWWSTTIDPYLTVAPRIDLVKGKLSFDVTLTLGVNTAWNSGVKILLEEALKNIKAHKEGEMFKELELKETCVYNPHAPIWINQDTELGKRICALKIKAISQANQKWKLYARLRQGT